jgi:radical SAM protein with 4Fe4S-binding SPASM domain
MPFTEHRSSLRLPTAPLLNHLDIELTERCDNACLHCYINRPAGDLQAKSRELSTAAWQQVLRQAAGLGALSVRFTGGEPLLREDFAELYETARRLGLKVTLFTNARRITPEIADLFARMPALENIEITVYGMTPASYDAAACAPGAYAGFRQGVRCLLERGVPFILKSALLPHNRPDMPALDAWAASMPWMKEPPVYAMFFDLRARRDSAARSQVINALRVPPEEGVALLNQRLPNYHQEMQRFCQRFIGPPGDALFTCGAGQAGCIDAYGSYQPCMLLRDPALTYPLRFDGGETGGLRHALTDVFPRLKQIKAANPRYLERCARCFLHGLCDQCPAKSWMEHGTLDTPVEYLCQVAHTQARYLGLLAAGEQAWLVQDWPQRLPQLQLEHDRENR